MRVNVNISDLFFNTLHETLLDQHGKFDGYADLENEATDFLHHLDQLGVATPSVPDLIADFNHRL